MVGSSSASSESTTETTCRLHRRRISAGVSGQSCATKRASRSSTSCSARSLCKARPCLLSSSSCLDTTLRPVLLVELHLIAWLSERRARLLRKSRQAQDHKEGAPLGEAETSLALDDFLTKNSVPDDRIASCIGLLDWWVFGLVVRESEGLEQEEVDPEESRTVAVAEEAQKAEEAEAITDGKRATTANLCENSKTKRMRGLSIQAALWEAHHNEHHRMANWAVFLKLLLGSDQRNKEMDKLKKDKADLRRLVQHSRSPVHHQLSKSQSFEQIICCEARFLRS